MDNWWYQGHIIGWENLFVHQAYELMKVVIGNSELSSDVANFEDGYKATVICDAILRASDTGKKQVIKY